MWCASLTFFHFCRGGETGGANTSDANCLRYHEVSTFGAISSSSTPITVWRCPQRIGIYGLVSSASPQQVGLCARLTR